MALPANHKHTASRHINASPQIIYGAFLTSEAMSRWLAPDGATADIDVFEPRLGGRFRMTLTFDSAPGKSSDNTDIVEGRFIDLVPGKRIVQALEFASEDPAFAGTMTMAWHLAPALIGTNVTVIADDVPRGISQTSHEAGMTSTLANLAAFVE